MGNEQLTEYQIEVLINKMQSANEITDAHDCLLAGAEILGQALRLLGYDQLVDEFEKGA